MGGEVRVGHDDLMAEGLETAGHPFALSRGLDEDPRPESGAEHGGEALTLGADALLADLPALGEEVDLAFPLVHVDANMVHGWPLPFCGVDRGCSCGAVSATTSSGEAGRLRAIYALFEARNRSGSPKAFAAFDVLGVDGQRVMADPWTARRKRLADLLEAPPAGICLVPVTNDAPALWDTWVGMGGERIVLRELTSLYRPGVRSPAWLELKPKLTLEVVVPGGFAERVRWGYWGEAAMLEFRYTHPRTGAEVEIRQAVRVPRDQPFDLTIGRRLALVCWSVMPSGLLRHPLLARG